jgi:hypothetical protein
VVSSGLDVLVLPRQSTKRHHATYLEKMVNGASFSLPLQNFFITHVGRLIFRIGTHSSKKAPFTTLLQMSDFNAISQTSESAYLDQLATCPLQLSVLFPRDFLLWGHVTTFVYSSIFLSGMNVGEEPK